MTEDDLSTRPVQPLAEADLDDPVVASLGRAIDPPSRPVQAVHAIGRAVQSLGRWGPESWVTLAIVAGCVLFTFTQLSPSDIFSASTPAGGDMGAAKAGRGFCMLFLHGSPSRRYPAFKIFLLNTTPLLVSRK